MTWKFQTWERLILLEGNSATGYRLMWRMGGPTKWKPADAAKTDHGQDDGWGGRMGGRSSSRNHREEFPNSQAAPLRIENWKQTLGRGRWLGNYNHPDQLLICPTAAPAWQRAFWLSEAVITHWKLGLSLSPPRTPGTLQLISTLVIKDRLTFWKCVLDTWAICWYTDTFFPCPYGVGISRGQRDMSGTTSTHGTALFRSQGQSPMSGLCPAVWHGGGGNWKY